MSVLACAFVAYAVSLVVIWRAQDEAARRYAEWCRRQSWQPPYYAYGEMCYGDSDWSWGAVDMSAMPLLR